MNNQLISTEEQTGQTVWMILVTLLAIALVGLLTALGVYQTRLSSPYTRGVLALHGNQAQGQAIFLMNCAGCHGQAADGKIGPSLQGISDRKSKVGMIHQVISGQTPPMPQFQPSPQEMADLLSYLESL